MRSFSEQMMLWVPTVLTVMLLALFSMKVHWLDVSLVPNVVWVMTLAAVTLFPASWPVWLVFLLGLAVPLCVIFTAKSGKAHVCHQA